MRRIPRHIDLPEPPSPWRRHGPAVGIIAAVTIGLGCGLFGWGLSAGLPPQAAALLTLLAVTAWVGLASGPLSAGADDVWGGVVRAAAVADASLVTLIVLGEWGGGVIGWGTGLGVYLLWAVLALAGALAVQSARTPRGRAAWAVGMAALAMAAMASLFWSPGLLGALGPDARMATARLMLWINPAWAVTALAGSGVEFYWLEQPVLYSLARMGQDYPPPPTPWWAPALLWGALAAGLGLASGLRGSLGPWLHGT